MRKLAMIGLDAGDLLFLRAHAAQLPNLARLLEAGSVHDIDVGEAMPSGAIWPTFFGASSPGHHGVYHHLQWDEQAMRIRRPTDDWLYVEPFWYAMARAGVRVMTLDIPMTYPSRLQDGVEVINWGSHDTLGPYHANDRALERDIRSRFGLHPMGYEIPVQKTARELSSIRDKLVAGAKQKGRLVRWLLQQREWDFFLTAFGETHRGGHILWPEDGPASPIPRDALLDVYRAIDAEVGAITEQLASVPVLLFALHGMQPNLSQEHFMPHAMERINAIWRGAQTPDAAEAAKPSGLMRHLRRSLPPGLQNAVARAVPVFVRDWVVSRATTGGLDWAQTPGFAMLADFNGYVRLNLAGREGRGALAPDSTESERYLSLLRTSLMELRVAATAEPLVRDVLSLSSVYPGPRSHRIPDLIVTWAPRAPVEHVHSPRLGHIHGRRDTGRSGNHRMRGFAAMPAGETAPAQGFGSIMEFAGWVLARYGVAV